MKFKSILLTAVATLGLAAGTMAQVPNYVPTNGLVGWWPFNGNANDESGNGNNGTVNGATLTTDRFGNANSAYSFDGVIDNIEFLNTSNVANFGTGNFTLSQWFKSDLPLIGHFCNSLFKFGNTNNYYDITPRSVNSGFPQFHFANGNGQDFQAIGNQTVDNGNWFLLNGVRNGDTIKFYINGILQNFSIIPINANADNVGNLKIMPNACSQSQPTTVYVDDIGIWNRALTQQEITNMYNAINCANNSSITPQTNSLTTGSTASFTATTSDPNPSYVWQSDFGQGFQTLNNFGNYSGANSATLNISNVQLSEHNQPIRVITTSGNCIDTSNVSVINILDTCIVTVYDTLLTTVTDTLVINTLITGINPPNNLNTLKVFPNPTSTHITIDYGNYNAMSGYTLNIVNSIGQTVFTTPINQQTSYIDLSTWTGNGIYFVQLIDPQNNTIENRKIVIQ